MEDPAGHETQARPAVWRQEENGHKHAPGHKDDEPEVSMGVGVGLFEGHIVAIQGLGMQPIFIFRHVVVDDLSALVGGKRSQYHLMGVFNEAFALAGQEKLGHVSGVTVRGS